MQRRDSLWFHAGFRRLWAGDTISQFGSFVGQTALPLLAATVLAATPFEMGLLTAAENLAFLVIGLPAGVWVDRMRRRPLMMRADIARAVALLSVPVAWWAGWLTLTQLVVVALLVSVGTVFFDVAYQSYLPSLIGREKLVEGNAKLQASQSVAQIAGPSVGGWLTQLIGAANTVLTTGAGYVVSALFLWRIKETEPEPTRPGDTSLRAQVVEGLRFVFGNVTLRAITLCTASANLVGSVLMAVEILFLTRDLHLSPGAVGMMLTGGGVGGVLGALTTGWWTRRVGQARTIWVVCIVTYPPTMLIPLAQPGWMVALVPVGLVFFGYGVVVYNVSQVSYRQAICPDRLLGRMNASVRFVIWGTMPIGGLIGGALGETIGVRGTMWVSVIGYLVAITPLLLSPLRKLRDIPEEPAAPHTDSALLS
ncbi:MFS transporter [Amycolatopsis taiwanensis]|uniref:MFS transporter n=1 Tax=Amycolatopsis taiwanensis TaxID=342230 RepID=A0A9W6QZA3_9PSEU|nr:MFS transporter [Amycolatopsis taiwanensis]GLY66299.1 MFS transporter [Amycolatopsis taiwanensis]